jgi:hypothetical protein
VTALQRADRASVQRGPWSISIGPAILAVLLATACSALAQISAQSPQPDEQQSTIRGTVINSVTGAPIARALVFTPGNRFATLTDGEGHFEFALPKVESNNGHPVMEARYTFSPSNLLARKPGFLDDPNGRGQAETTPGAEITIPLLPEALIKGRILSSETDPAPGIVVRILSRQVQEGMPKWMPATTARANSNGEFRFAELLPGSYKLMTNELMDNDPAITVPGGKLYQAYGFAPVFYPGVSEYAAAGTIQLTAGQTVQADIPVSRQPYFNVEIPVANADLNTNINVTVSVQGHSGSNYALGYNAEKQRIEGLLPNGKYLVEATSGQNSASGAVNLAVTGAPAEGPSLTLIPNSSITVHVAEQFASTEWNGEMRWGGAGRTFQVHGPRIYLQISVESADDFGPRGASLRPPTGPEDDSLVLENLTPGRYWLRVHSARGYVAAATMGGVDLLREPLIVSPGSSAPIEITMRDDNAELDGTVAGITGPTSAGAIPSSTSPPQQAWVYCIPLPDSSGQFQQVWVSSDEKFTSAAMAPGTYRVFAFANQQPNLPYRDPEAMRAYETKGQVVHLSAAQKASVQLQIISSIE